MKILINSGLVVPVFKKRDKLILSMINNGHGVTISGYEDAAATCHEFGCKFKFIPMARAGVNPFKDAKTLINYYKLVKKEKYDVVHSYTAKPNIYGSIGARLAGCKKIYPTVNGLGYAFTGNSLKNKIVRFFICMLYKIAFSCSTKVFFQNQDDANEMIERRVIKKEKCVVISGSGIDLDKYPFSKTVNTSIFFLASRLLITKGLREYFKAAEYVKIQYPNARFLLAGAIDLNPDGIKEEELHHYIDSGSIEYLGLVDDMQRELSNCGVFVLPSYYREGVPHAILEAMSVGRAIITTDSYGCRETINGKNGYLVEAKNYKDLAEKMIAMLESPKKVKDMGLESRKYAEERFDVCKVNNIMLESMGL